MARGARSGSPASRELDPLVTWTHREALLLAALGPQRCDVVAVQENAWLGDGSTLAGRLAASLRLALAEAVRAEGLGVLSRGTIRAVRSLELRCELYGYPSPLAVTTDLDDIEITVVCVHLPLASSGDREPILRELVERLEGVAAPVFICGDLNLEPDDPLLEGLRAAGFVDATRDLAATMPNPEPQVRLDYVLVRAGRVAEVDVVATAVLGDRPDAAGFLPSDHLGAVVELELRRRS
jgi:endonuclease/exonuclease/phosphatase family metal-dependent hydrolase